MDSGTVGVLTVLIGLAAVLYASVGHGGASGYLAAMALFGVSPAVMKPTALMLNMLVASIATVQFHRAGCFSLKTFWPFAVVSIPAAFAGGFLVLPDRLYKVLIGVVLLCAAARLVWRPTVAFATRALPLRSGLAAGSAIGLLSGMVGVGGGIFLTPLLLLKRWAQPRTAAAVSAAFILVNSCAGLLGHLSAGGALPAPAPAWAAAAAAGGWLGAGLGSRHLDGVRMRQALAAVLLVAAVKMTYVG